VLDERVMPAVTYPQPGGPDWEQLADLLRPLAGSPDLLGVSVADHRPDLDPGGSCGRRVVRLLAQALPLGPGSAGAGRARYSRVRRPARAANASSAASTASARQARARR
jgi:hypothetical protein